MQARRISMVVGAAVVALGGWWLVAEPAQPDDSAAAAASPGGERVAVAVAASQPLRPASIVTTGPDHMLNPALLRIFDSVLSEAQATSKAAFMAMAPALLEKHLPAELRVRALGLLERYIDMQEAMRSVAQPDPNDAASMRRALEARAEVRRRYFSPEEVEGMFGDEIRQDNYMAEKLEIIHNASLTPAQRQAALESTETAWLTEEQRKERRETMAHVDVQRQTDELEARGASAQERFAARSALYGSQAATNLANLDRENQEWNQRLDQYANAPAAEQEQLRQSLFDENERMRIDAALALRSSRLTQAGSTPSPSEASRTPGQNPS
ncbi:lipase secretion chaperone [Variovorax sp. J22R133]|uniref:lipase secretion chaperone n=1 Tax=Variovorax brevis TaxID=3053503 RepID=UPI002575CF0A|nr:lipase secretion chaperone [Variovorax sp. J22R133]MDM0111593.1 lipase secretion chaperone [Variovorax sp. J22R133]